MINSPMNIYEMHAGSWKMKEGGKPYNYSELADELIDVYKRQMLSCNFWMICPQHTENARKFVLIVFVFRTKSLAKLVNTF